MGCSSSRTVFAVAKGDNYQTTRVKLATDLTSDMLEGYEVLSSSRTGARPHRNPQDASSSVNRPSAVVEPG